MRHFSERVLLTDLYELNMLQAYFLQDMNEEAVFEFFVRDLPTSRNFLLTAGLEQVVEYLTGLRFDTDDLEWMAASGKFKKEFIASLRDLRFTGDVDAMPEGTICFGNEPVLRIAAPMREAQLVESRVINLLHYQTIVASKAARCVLAAEGKPLIDFGLRRAHGAEAALLSARASYIAGFDGTATAIAAPMMGIPVYGTMAHSYVQTHDREIDAFASYARAFPRNATLLIDTYDTEAGAMQAVRAAQWLRGEDIRIKAVRIDSGNLGASASRVRRILDEGDCREIGIFVSGNLDEHVIHSLIEHNAPIDGFGVGTRMNTSADASFLDCAYKLVEYAGLARRKRSEQKATWPGRKQVYRYVDDAGQMTHDCLTLITDAQAGQPMLQPIMRDGRLQKPLPALEQIRATAKAQLSALPSPLRVLSMPTGYAVRISEPLQALAEEVDRRHTVSTEEDNAIWGFEDE